MLRYTAAYVILASCGLPTYAGDVGALSLVQIRSHKNSVMRRNAVNHSVDVELAGIARDSEKTIRKMGAAAQLHPHRKLVKQGRSSQVQLFGNAAVPEIFGHDSMDGSVKRLLAEPRQLGQLSQARARRTSESNHASARQSPAWNDMGLNPPAVQILTSDGPDDHVSWNLCGKAFHSNLAGVGPDAGEQSLRYFNVTTAGGGQALDLVVTANSSYKAKNEQVNGVSLGSGCFGVVNLKAHFSGYSEVHMLFSWYLHGTNTSVALSKYYATVSDLDTGSNSQEHVTFYNRVAHMYLADHVLDISGKLTGVGLTLSGTQQGTGSDNPDDPMALTEEDKQKSVMVEYVGQTQWRIKWAITGGNGGRSFYFTGDSNMFDATTTTTTTTTCVTRSCQVFADPHVSGFDNMDNQGPKYLAFWRGSHRGMGTSTGSSTFDRSPIDFDALDVGDFWLVKSDPVHIQARFRLSGEFIPDRAAIGAVAVGGPFIKNITIIVEPLDGHVTVDGTEVQGSWSNKHEGIQLQQQSEDHLDIILPMSVTLKIKRFPKHIDVKITMPELPGGVDGECGNFDGIAENDAGSEVQNRMGNVLVEDSLLLFRTKFQQEISFGEEDYQAVASLHDDEAMTTFVKRLLASENKYVPLEQESELEGFVPWFSGVMATQTLQQLKEELFVKTWVRDRPAPDAVTDATPGDLAVHGPSDAMNALADFGEHSACSTCLLWGASHILSFSAFRKHYARHPKREPAFRIEDWQASRQSITEAGTYWLVNTQNVQIQGSFWENATDSGVLNLGALAIGGSFLDGNKLFIRSGQVEWNRERILTDLSSKFSNRLVAAEFTPHAEYVSNGLVGNGLQFTFHNDMTLTVNYHHKVLDAKIHMCEPQAGSGIVEGQCGSLGVGQRDEKAVGEAASHKLKKHEIFVFDNTAP